MAPKMVNGMAMTAALWNSCPDEPMMKEMFYSFSERTRYLRFHGPMKSFPHARLQVFCNIDYEQEVTLICLVGQPGEEDVVALGCYLHDQGTNTAEVAFSVRDGINVARYALKRLSQGGGDPVERLLEAVRFVLGEEALGYAPAPQEEGPRPKGPHRV